MSSSETGHQVPKNSIYSDQQQDPEIQAFKKYQSEVPKPSQAELAKMIVQTQKYGVLCTQSIEDGVTGFPAGSTVEYAPDEAGRPIFCISSLSSHTKDLKKCTQASLHVQSTTFKNMSDGRVSIIGNILRVPDSEQSVSKELFMKFHPESYWVQFGDFEVYKMEKVLKARLIGGFAMAGWVDGDTYESAISDPVNEFSAPISKHMNEDHSDALLQLVEHYAGIKVDNATMQSIDRLGIVVVCERGEQKFKCRIAFPESISTRLEARQIIIVMTKAAQDAQAAKTQ